jgi:cytochrome subunit of sulfide dehydrogenase
LLFVEGETDIRARLTGDRRISKLRDRPRRQNEPEGERPMKAVALVTIIALSSGIAAAQSPAPDWGRNLAATCANCHGTNGRSSGTIERLAGTPAAQIIERMKEFQTGKRPATIMHQLAKGYSDEQIAAMAAFFAAQKP